MTPVHVSKWEGTKHTQTTLRCPIALYFGVSLDELMSFDQKRIDEEIESTPAEYYEADRRRDMQKRRI